MKPKKVKARLDAKRRAKPKTRLLGHVRTGDEGTCSPGPGDTYEDVTTGERIDLTASPDELFDPRGCELGENLPVRVPGKV